MTADEYQFSANGRLHRVFRRGHDVAHEYDRDGDLDWEYCDDAEELAEELLRVVEVIRVGAEDNRQLGHRLDEARERVVALEAENARLHVELAVERDVFFQQQRFAGKVEPADVERDTAIRGRTGGFSQPVPRNGQEGVE